VKPLSTYGGFRIPESRFLIPRAYMPLSPRSQLFHRSYSNKHTCARVGHLFVGARERVRERVDVWCAMRVSHADVKGVRPCAVRTSL